MQPGRLPTLPKHPKRGAAPGSTIAHAFVTDSVALAVHAPVSVEMPEELARRLILGAMGIFSQNNGRSNQRLKGPLIMEQMDPHGYIVS